MNSFSTSFCNKALIKIGLGSSLVPKLTSNKGFYTLVLSSSILVGALGSSLKLSGLEVSFDHL